MSEVTPRQLVSPGVFADATHLVVPPLRLRCVGGLGGRHVVPVMESQALLLRIRGLFALNKHLQMSAFSPPPSSPRTWRRSIEPTLRTCQVLTAHQ